MTFSFVPLFWLPFAALAVSCCAQRETADAIVRAQPSAPLILGDKEGGVKLLFPFAAHEKKSRAAMELSAFGEVLFSAASEGDSLWLDNRLVRVAKVDVFQLVERRSSNEWEYAAIDLTASYDPGLKYFKRHLLFVQPDLFVICDEIAVAQPAAIETGFWFPESLDFDSARSEWRVQSANAGLTIRAFGSPGAGWRSQLASDTTSGGPAASQLGKCLRAGVTEKVAELRQIIVLVPHEKNRKRSLAFKLLESDTAIGVRAHRDGLPTLIAFRKYHGTAEADLTGLKFTAPVAVDVFRPKRK